MTCFWPLQGVCYKTGIWPLKLPAAVAGDCHRGSSSWFSTWVHLRYGWKGGGWAQGVWNGNRWRSGLWEVHDVAVGTPWSRFLPVCPPALPHLCSFPTDSQLLLHWAAALFFREHSAVWSPRPPSPRPPSSSLSPACSISNKVFPTEPNSVLYLCLPHSGVWLRALPTVAEQ